MLVSIKYLDILLLFFLLIYVIVFILTFTSRKIFMLGLVEHETSFITSGPDYGLKTLTSSYLKSLDNSSG